MSWDVSLLAFGMPSDPTTFSGCAANLLCALKGAGHLRREFSSKNLRTLDALGGAFSFRSFPRVSISRRWMWSRTGHAILSERLNRLVDGSGDRGPFLEIGTMLHLDSSLGSHYQLTDMTIAQARRSGYFDVGRLPAKLISEAETLQSEIVSRARHVFAFSEWTAASLKADCGVQADRVSVVYAGANLQIPGDITAPRKERDILFVGLDWERKGGPILLEAFRAVRREIPDATLRIVGCSPRIDDEGVIVEGQLHRRDPAQFRRLCRAYLEAACFCLPSAFDPFPIAIIEAMSADLPVVAFDNGSRREAVVNGDTGLLVRLGDRSALAAALLTLLQSSDLRLQMGRSAGQRARQQFSWTRVVERMGTVIGAGPRVAS